MHPLYRKLEINMDGNGVYREPNQLTSRKELLTSTQTGTSEVISPPLSDADTRCSKLKRSWNSLLWGGFAIAFLAFPAYFIYFIRFQSTREIPWPNFLLSGLALFMLGLGLWRAYKRPEAYRGKIAGPILASLGVLLIGYFFSAIYVGARKLPASANAPQIGQRVPDFTLPDSKGQPVTLSALLSQPFSSNDWPAASAAASKKTAGAVLIFYRGYW
jgi:hypothetical protein